MRRDEILSTPLLLKREIFIHPETIIMESANIDVSSELIQLIPDLKCALTQDMFEDPVIWTDGRTYERSAIIRYVFESTRGKILSPYTQMPFDKFDYRQPFWPNVTLLNVINHLKAHPVVAKSSSSSRSSSSSSSSDKKRARSISKDPGPGPDPRQTTDACSGAALREEALRKRVYRLESDNRSQEEVLEQHVEQLDALRAENASLREEIERLNASSDEEDEGEEDSEEAEAAVEDENSEEALEKRSAATFQNCMRIIRLQGLEVQRSPGCTEGEVPARMMEKGMRVLFRECGQGVEGWSLLHCTPPSRPVMRDNFHAFGWRYNTVDGSRVIRNGFCYFPLKLDLNKYSIDDHAAQPGSWCFVRCSPDRYKQEHASEAAKAMVRLQRRLVRKERELAAAKAKIKMLMRS